jgi:hypothetical protein
MSNNDIRRAAPVSIGLPLLTGQEARKFAVGLLKANQKVSAVMLSQAIPGSKVERLYAVQFDTQPDGSPRSDWHPLFVVVWKAEKLEKIIFDPILRSTVGINGHLVQPPSGQSAIYALQPDYSLKQLPFTAEETTRLFSHITAIQIQKDKRVASLVELLEEDQDLNEKLSAEFDEERRFPPNDYWEQKVDPYIQIVEP